MTKTFAVPGLAASAFMALIALGAASPALADQWVGCAREHGVCDVPPGTRVRYGAEGRFVDQVAGGRFVCDNANFGADPLFGAEKVCAFLSRGVVVVERPWEDRSDWELRDGHRR